MSTDLVSQAPPSDLELIEVTKRYGSTVAVDALTLTIPSGAYCCLWARRDAARPRPCAWSRVTRSSPAERSGWAAATSPGCPRGQASQRHDVPELRALPAPDGPRQRGVRPQDARSGQDRAPPASPALAGAGGHGALRRAPARPALGRPAAAHRVGPRPHHRSADSAPRRAALRPRSVPARAHARGVAAPAAGAGHHLRPRHPRPGRGHGAGRPRRGDERGAPRAAGLTRARSSTGRAPPSWPASSGDTT